jgi:glycosyltransferase involved in cell wall biosynthesis
MASASAHLQPLSLSVSDLPASVQLREVEYAGYVLGKGHTSVQTHPQFAHLKSPPDGYMFTSHPGTSVYAGTIIDFIKRFNPDEAPPHTGVAALDLIVGEVVSIARAAIGYGSTVDAVRVFLLDRNIEGCVRIPEAVSLAFIPTFPFSIGGTPWIVEIEDTTTLFDPYLCNGDTAKVDPRSLPCFPVLKALLESSSCRGILTHIRSTAESVRLLFSSEIIARKTFFVAMGVDLPRLQADGGARASQTINLLFTNSWHQEAKSFFLRGGHDVLEAFSRLCEKYPQLVLTIRSALPSLSEKHRKLVETHPRIRVVPGFLDDAALDRMMRETDVYLLPAAHMHIVSMLKAMAYGIPVIVSDGWGFDEYIQDGYNGFIVKGRRNRVSWEDPEHKMLREDYRSIVAPDGITPEVVDGLEATIIKLIDGDYRRQISQQARASIESHYTTVHWNHGLKTVLDTIYDRGVDSIDTQIQQMRGKHAAIIKDMLRKKVESLEDTPPKRPKDGNNTQGGLEVRDLFENGNFMDRALASGSDCWQHYAALSLIGVFDEALDGLARFRGEEALFYTGVTLWIRGDAHWAEAYLQACQSEEARRLLELIRKPRIDVLTQVPPGSSQYVPDFAACAEERFRIKNIADDGGDGLRHSRVSPGTDVREFLSGDFNPAFYLCREIEWMALPANLHKLECPVFGHTEDYDIHLQAILPQYSLFDSVVTCGSYEWNALSRMLSVPVCTFPKAYGLQKGIPDLGNNKRDIDLFFSGTIFHPYHPDKAKFVNGLLDRLDGTLNLKVISSHLPTDEYFKLLGRTKICLPYVRFGGSMPTRGLEALAMGNALIVQKGCSLSAYFGEEDGVFTCDYSSAELPALIERISKNWQDIAPRAERGARRVREEFSMQRVSAEYLRFLTVLSAIVPRRANPPLGQVPGKRSVISVGWTHDSDYYLESLAARARAFGDTAWFNPGAINDFAREVLLFYATSADQKVVDKITRWGRWPVPVPEFLGKALDLLRNGVAMFPRFLALQFNLMRTLHHFGDSQGEVRKMAEAIVASQESDWDISPLDDVLPYDFFPEHFNYRAYFDLAVKVQGEGKTGAPGFLLLIRASSAHYASMAGGPVESARTAAGLDPEFPLYRLDLAKRLAATKNSRREAAQILAGLAGGDIVPLGAWDELQKLNLLSELPPEAAQALSLRVGRIRARIEQQP